MNIFSIFILLMLIFFAWVYYLVAKNLRKPSFDKIIFFRDVIPAEKYGDVLRRYVEHKDFIRAAIKKRGRKRIVDLSEVTNIQRAHSIMKPELLGLKEYSIRIAWDKFTDIYHNEHEKNEVVDRKIKSTLEWVNVGIENISDLFVQVKEHYEKDGQGFYVFDMYYDSSNSTYTKAYKKALEEQEKRNSKKD